MSSICSSCKSPKGANTSLEDRGNLPYQKGEKRKGSDFSLSGVPINSRTGNPMGPTPPGHKAKYRMAGIPPENDRVKEDKDEEDEEEEENDGVEEAVEFKQFAQVHVDQHFQKPLAGPPSMQQKPMAGPPATQQKPQPVPSRLMALIKKHDNRKKSFDSLFGGPESDYNGIG